MWVFFNSLLPLPPVHPLHKYLDISQAITAESSPLHIAISRTFVSQHKSLTTKLRTLIFFFFAFCVFFLFFLNFYDRRKDVSFILFLDLYPLSLVLRIRVFFFNLIFFFFLSGFSFTIIHKSQDSKLQPSSENGSHIKQNIYQTYLFLCIVPYQYCDANAAFFTASFLLLFSV